MQGNEDTTEDKIPKLSKEASLHEILQFLNAFQRVRRTMDWTTGPKLVQKFPMHLTGYHLDIWEQVAAGQPAPVDGFNETLQTFKTELLRGYTYEDQMDYLRSLRKTGKMEPSRFLLKLRAANRMATQLPDASEFEHRFTAATTSLSCSDATSLARALWECQSLRTQDKYSRNQDLQRQTVREGFLCSKKQAARKQWAWWATRPQQKKQPWW